MKPSSNRLLSLFLALMILFTTCCTAQAEEAGPLPSSIAAENLSASTPQPDHGAEAVPTANPTHPSPDGSVATLQPVEEEGQGASADPSPSPAAEEGSSASEEPSYPGALPVAPGDDGAAVPAPSQAPAEDSLDSDPSAPDGLDALLFDEGICDSDSGVEFEPFVIDGTDAKIDGEALSVVLITSSASYDRIYIGRKDDKNKEPYYPRSDYGAGTYAFRFPLPISSMGESVAFVPGRGDGTWYTDEDLYLNVPVVEPRLEAKGAETSDPSDGDYTTEVDSDSAMFKVASCALNVKGGKITATITLSGTGYDKLFVGTAGQAAAANSSEHIGFTVNADGKYSFVLPVSALDTPVAISAHSISKDMWYDRTLIFKSSSLQLVAPAGPADGDYTTEVESDSTMFKVVSCALNVKGGKITATIALSGTGYDKLFVGTAAQAGAADPSEHIGYTVNADGKYSFVLSVPALDTPVAISAHSISKDLWYDRTLTFKSASINPVAPSGPADGDYTTEVESDSAMFKVVSCALKIQGGKITATIALSGTGYDKLSVGTAEQAALAGASEHIGYTVNADGKFIFVLSVPALDTPVAISAHSISKDLWYDRTLTFKSASLQPISGSGEDPDDEDDDDDITQPGKDPSGSTSRINASTALADGVYTPDKFSFSGGTGRVTISCPKVTVQGGKAFATIVFSSPNYTYVKASGNKYYGSHGGGTSTFEIPVKLNSSNRIIGMTTAMSTDREITYSLYIFIAGADDFGDKPADENAPELTGMKYESTDKIEFAENFSIYRYTDGFVVLKVVGGMNYLLVPENAEVSAGLDEGMAVIRVPVRNVYTAARSVLDLMDRVGALDAFKLIGRETDVEPIASGLEQGKLVSADTYTELDYSALLKNGCDLVILPSTITDEEYSEISQRLAMLGIPAFRDRSTDETTERAQLEWLRLYGVLFGCEDLVEAYLAHNAAA